MDFGFAFLIMGIALVVFFIEEITICVQGFWNKHWLRHVSLMMFIGFFGLAYSPSLANLLQVITHFSNIVALACAPYIPFIENKLLVVFAMLHILLSFFITAIFYGFYFIATRKKFAAHFEMLWLVWLVITVLYTPMS